MPGDNVEMNVELITPIALETGQRFAIREGGHTVGAGAITEIAGVDDDGTESRAGRSIQLACTECKERTYTTTQEQEERSQPDRAAEVLPT